MKEAKVASATEPFGQHMLEKQPEEFGAGFGSILHAFGFAVLITEGDHSIFTGDDVFLLNHAAIKVTPEIN